MALAQRMAGRTRLAVAEYLESFNLRKAAEASGGVYKNAVSASNSGKQFLERPAATVIVRDALRIAGLDASAVAKSLKSLIKAKKVQYFSHEGAVTDKRTTKDNTIRLKATELVGRYIGADVQLVELKHQGVLGIAAMDLSSMSDAQLTEIIDGKACPTEDVQERQGVQHTQCRRARRVERPA